jgi:hypothetical protein
VRARAKIIRAASAGSALAASLFVGVTPASSASAPSSTLAVTLTNTTITVGSETVPTGEVAFTIRNRSKLRRSFSIAGHSTGIDAGKSGVLRVTFRSAGSFAYVSTARGQSARPRGVLTVVEPCLNPTSTTVTVKLAQGSGGLAVSQTTVPCGSVTFVVSDTGTLNDSLHVFGDGPGPHGSTPELFPGQTAAVTVQFASKGLAHIESGDYPPEEPEFGGDYGEEAQLTID